MILLLLARLLFLKYQFNNVNAFVVVFSKNNGIDSVSVEAHTFIVGVVRRHYNGLSVEALAI